MLVGSTFTGIGGLDLGLERAGMRVAWQCEADPYRRGVLARWWPDVPCYEDIRIVGSGMVERRQQGDDDCSEGLAGLDNIDLLCGGFPCQDVSVAGRRAGLVGERSGLFFEFARVAESVRPRWLLVENVPGLLSSNGGRDFGCVLGTLADIGYGLAWRVLDSRFFGVPQRRRRVFILGALVDGDPRAAAERAGQVLAVGSRCERHSQTRGEAGEDVAVASLSGLGTGGPDDNDGQGGRLVAPALVKRHGKGTDSDATDALVTGFHMIQTPIDEPDGTPALGRKSSGMGVCITPLQEMGRSPGNEAQPAFAAGVRRLTPTEAERLQGFPDGWTDGPDSRRYAALGDAVTVNVAEWIGRRIMRAGL